MIINKTINPENLNVPIACIAYRWVFVYGAIIEHSENGILLSVYNHKLYGSQFAEIIIDSGKMTKLKVGPL